MDFCCTAWVGLWHQAAEAMAVSLRRLSGEQRKCMDGGPRLPLPPGFDPKPSLRPRWKTLRPALPERGDRRLAACYPSCR